VANSVIGAHSLLHRWESEESEVVLKVGYDTSKAVCEERVRGRAMWSST
jgi:hypothetical protein